MRRLTDKSSGISWNDDMGECSGDAGGTGGVSKKMGVRKLKTVLDIDSTLIGNFDEDDKE